MITLKGVSAIRFHIQTDEWPIYAKERNLEDPFKRMHQQTIFENGYCELGGKKIPCTRVKKNPNAPPVPTAQEKADYRFEEEKFVIRRLIEEGYYSDIQWDIENCYPGNQERLQEYVKTLRACEGTGQCSMFCGHYKECMEDLWRLSEKA